MPACVVSQDSMLAERHWKVEAELDVAGSAGGEAVELHHQRTGIADDLVVERGFVDEQGGQLDFR